MAKWQKKPKQTAEVVQKLIQALQNGLDRSSARSLAWVHKNTFYEWLKDDEFRAKMEDAEDFWMAYVNNKKKSIIDKGYRPAIESELKAKRRDVYGDKLGIDDGKGWSLFGNIKIKIVK